MQVEHVGIPDAPDPAGDRADPFARLDADHLAHMRIVAYQRSELRLGEHGDPRPRVRRPKGAEQGGGEQDVPDGAEAHHEDVGSGEEGGIHAA